ncbi:MAG: hypothetical protein ONB48_00770 [candidate division KSB1 bacterium]|nr:hypothetical protein [candidate division KSB1 bacterium]MDZ7272791.1 hypothetical protein [candidate division KSB1 bacterium]MDZ7284185.1 hypothetical protein [candidate division KSB1 bacterium]MDZ7297417.1 hypothetical protein [candidate division KSB1 bacterium]MDZ7306523.1 hypothetical protein [candidate division KSB1 bacterium]
MRKQGIFPRQSPRWRAGWHAAALLALGLALWTCAQKPTSPDTTGDFSVVPTNLALVLGDRQLSLAWTIPDPGGVRNFRIYRFDSSQIVITPPNKIERRFKLLDSTRALNYVDRTVRNGVTYFYQVSAVSNKGYEGPRSAEVAGRPNVYGVRIASGVNITRDPKIVLTITAPATTVLMKVSNDTALSRVSWQPFLASLNWTLSAGDGQKTVYLKLRDRDGSESSMLASDPIILDTKAIITSVTENTGGTPKQSNQIIHFTLTAGEPNGRAFIDIVNAVNDILLFDDGSNNDRVANDGIYEVDYRIPGDVEIAQAKIRGRFTDQVGNVATPFLAATQVTILKVPDAVQLFTPVPTGSPSNALRLTWSVSSEADFANYALYRSRTKNFTPSPGLLIERVTVQQTTSYIDANLQPGVSYYYQIVVNDIGGLSSKPSNEVEGKISPDAPPAAVTLNTPLLVGDGTSKVQLSWSQSGDRDFASYRVYRSLTPRVDSLSTLVTAIVDIGGNVFVDEGLSASTTYYYRVYVTDQGRNATGSNIESVTTAQNTPPFPVTLAQPAVVDTSSLRLSWSQSLDADFASYRIFRSEIPGVTNGTRGKDAQGNDVDVLIAILNANPGNTTYTDTNLRSTRTYYYRVFVYDRGNLSSGSNEVKARIRP